MTVDDAHSLVRNALEGTEGNDGLHGLCLADLNETERERAVQALNALHALDESLGERSSLQSVDDPSRANHNPDYEVTD